VAYYSVDEIRRLLTETVIPAVMGKFSKLKRSRDHNRLKQAEQEVNFKCIFYFIIVLF
jgi:hypothetical protein